METKPGELRIETFGDDIEYVYKGTDFIARGRYGTVFKATVNNNSLSGEGNNQPVVAVKLIHLDHDSGSLSNPENWIKLCSRLKKLLELKNDHLVSYHKVTVTRSLEASCAELIMDYCSGGDLASVLRNLKKNAMWLDRPECIGYALDIAKGMRFLHKNGLIHGDLKPGNILVKCPMKGEKRLVIGDLDDLVQMQQDATCSKDITHLRGTPRYMSPEMLRKFADLPAETPGRGTDIWSLGCIILELADCMVGNHKKWLECRWKKNEAGNKISDSDFIIKIIDGYVPLVASTIPADIASCIQKCLCISSTNRISAGRLKRELLLAKEVSVINILFLHCWKNLFNDLQGYCKVSLQSFEPLTNTIRRCPLPAGLRGRNFLDEFTALDGGILCQTTGCVSNVGCEIITLHMLTKTWQPVGFPVTAAFPQMYRPVSVNNQVYFWSWSNFPETLSTFNVLNTSDGNLTSLMKPLTVKRCFPSCAVRRGNDIFCIGKRDIIAQPSMWTASFDTQTNEWERLPDFPELRHYFAITVLQGNVYVLGGTIFSTHPLAPRQTKSCFRFDGKSRRWERIHDLLQPRIRHSAFAFDNRIFVYGGEVADGKGLQRMMEVYDTQKYTWSEIPLLYLDNNDGFGSELLLLRSIPLFAV